MRYTNAIEASTVAAYYQNKWPIFVYRRCEEKSRIIGAGRSTHYYVTCRDWNWTCSLCGSSRFYGEDPENFQYYFVTTDTTDTLMGVNMPVYRLAVTPPVRVRERRKRRPAQIARKLQ